MEKQVKIIITILMVIIILTTLADVVLATDAGSVLSSIAQGGTTVSTTGVENFGKAVISVVRVVGIIVAVVILLVLGIKYMTGSAEERAEYKKTMIPYIVGAVLIFASATIVTMVYELSTSLNGTGITTGPTLAS